MKLREIASIIGGHIIGNPEIDITGISNIKDAQRGDITFIADKKSQQYAYATNASAIIAKDKIEGISASIVITDNPRLAFAKALEIFYRKPSIPSGVSKEALIGKGVNLGNDVTIFPFVYIADNVTIGDHVIIFPFVYIGNNVFIGEDTLIYPNVTIRENVKVGKKVIIHSGAVIGSDGFGYVQDKGKNYKIPQVGGVIIEDDVEIGANVTIDRATLGNTIIGKGTKIDNLIQIAHNVKIGKDCLMAAQVGIAGSTELGDRVMLAGQVGIADHKHISDDVIVGAKSGVSNNLKPGVYSGILAIPHKDWLRAQGVYTKLPELLKRVRAIETEVSLLKDKFFNSTKEEDNFDDG